MVDEQPRRANTSRPRPRGTLPGYGFTPNVVSNQVAAAELEDLSNEERAMLHAFREAKRYYL